MIKSLSRFRCAFNVPLEKVIDDFSSIYTMHNTSLLKSQTTFHLNLTINVDNATIKGC